MYALKQSRAKENTILKESMNLKYLKPRQSKSLGEGAFGIVTGFMTGLVTGFVTSLVTTLMTGLVTYFMTDLVTGFVTGLVTSLVTGLNLI